MLLWDYLHENAKFYCPPIPCQDEPVQLRVLTVNEIELIQPNSPGVQYAFRDVKMVDNLLEEMRDRIREVSITGEDEVLSEHMPGLAQLRDKYGALFCWFEASFYPERCVRTQFPSFVVSSFHAYLFLYYRNTSNR